MVTWDAKLYMDARVQKHPQRYRQRLEKRGRRRCFCIALAAKPENSLEIYSARTPWYWYQQERGIHVVGLAASYKGAVRLLSQIVTDIGKEQNEISTAVIREYFK